MNQDYWNVERLIALLRTLPSDLPLWREGGEYNGQTRRVERIEVNHHAGFGVERGVIFK